MHIKCVILCLYDTVSYQFILTNATFKQYILLKIKIFLVLKLYKSRKNLYNTYIFIVFLKKMAVSWAFCVAHNPGVGAHLHETGIEVIHTIETEI